MSIYRSGMAFEKQSFAPAYHELTRQGGAA